LVKPAAVAGTPTVRSRKNVFEPFTGTITLPVLLVEKALAPGIQLAPSAVVASTEHTPGTMALVQTNPPVKLNAVIFKGVSFARPTVQQTKSRKADNTFPVRRPANKISLPKWLQYIYELLLLKNFKSMSIGNPLIPRPKNGHPQIFSGSA
jgi:hypothetical protein